MLQKLRSMLASRSTLTYAEYVSSLDIETKPFAKALFLRAATLLDEAHKDFKNEGLELHVDKAMPLTDFACLALSTIAYNITLQAGDAVDAQTVFLPHESAPHHASMVVAFGMYVALGIHIRLKEDGISIDAKEALGRTAIQFFTFHPDDEGSKHFANAFNTFQEIAAYPHASGHQWMEACVNLVAPYVLQWTTSDDDHKAQDYPKQFGSLLERALGALHFDADFRKRSAGSPSRGQADLSLDGRSVPLYKQSQPLHPTDNHRGPTSAGEQMEATALPDLSRDTVTSNANVAGKYDSLTLPIQLTGARTWVDATKRQVHPLATRSCLEVEGHFLPSLLARSVAITITPDRRNLWEVPVWGLITFVKPEHAGKGYGSMNCFQVKGSDEDTGDESDHVRFFISLPESDESKFRDADSLPMLTLTVFGLTKVKEANISGNAEHEWHRERARHIAITHWHLGDPQAVDSSRRPGTEAAE